MMTPRGLQREAALLRQRLGDSGCPTCLLLQRLPLERIEVTKGTAPPPSPADGLVRAGRCRDCGTSVPVRRLVVVRPAPREEPS